MFERQRVLTEPHGWGMENTNRLAGLERIQRHQRRMLSRANERLIDVIWNDETYAMFAKDLHEREEFLDAATEAGLPYGRLLSNTRV
jgi:hypothetical protein